jgi:hypothetical protein
VQPTALLRSASVLSALFCAGHTLGRPWTPATSPEAISLVQALQSVHFNVMGANRSYWDFYEGFGISISVYLVVQTILLWQLASLIKENAATGGDASRFRPMIAMFALGSAANAVIAWKFFFLLPLAFGVVIVALLAWAFAVAKPAPGVVPVSR